MQRNLNRDSLGPSISMIPSNQSSTLNPSLFRQELDSSEQQQQDIKSLKQ